MAQPDPWMPRQPAGRTHDSLLPGYRDLVPIARSETSEVYRAYQEGVGRPVAIKVLRLDDAEAASRFAREIGITVQLGRQHPHIVTVLDIGTTSGGRPCLVMDYYERGSLHERLRERAPLPADEVLAAGIAVADTLAFAHGHGVLHRDIKPQNILILPTTYVLADFGIARRVDAASTSSADWLSFRHASPQVLDGEPPVVEDDLWALGSTLFTLLDGHPPFAEAGEDSALAYMRRVRTGTPRSLRRADVPAGLADIVERCLRRERGERFPDAAALRDALAGLTADTAAWAPTPQAPVGSAAMAELVASAMSDFSGYADPPPVRRRPVRALAGVVLAAVLVGALGLLVSRAPDRAAESAPPPPAPSVSASAEPSPSPLPTRSANVNNPALAPAIAQLEARGDTGVFLRWRDESAGTATFIVVQVVGGRGDALRTLPPGTTQLALDGLDPATAPYCFHVIAFLGSERGVSPRRCLA